jgi:hypothetical protein
MAFFRGDVDEARRLRDSVAQQGPARWQLTTTITDLRIDVTHHGDPGIRNGLTAVLGDLEVLLVGEPSGTGGAGA